MFERAFVTDPSPGVPYRQTGTELDIKRLPSVFALAVLTFAAGAGLVGDSRYPSGWIEPNPWGVLGTENQPCPTVRCSSSSVRLRKIPKGALSPPEDLLDLPLDWLNCPFCGGSLNAPRTRGSAADGGFGSLTCWCGAHPVVAGIPILKKGAITHAGHTSDDLIALIEAGRPEDALLALLSPPPPTLAPSWMRRLPSVKGVRRLRGIWHAAALPRWRAAASPFLAGSGDQLTGCGAIRFAAQRWGGAWQDPYGYFACRFGQPRHLVALSLASTVRAPTRPILDLACGFGHITYELLKRVLGQPVIGLDLSFTALYIAKKWIAPEAVYVCCDAETALPFKDGLCSTVFCSDAFHYIVNKAACMRELRRLTADDGAIMLAVVRNALVEHNGPDYHPLPPDGYRALAGDMRYRLLPSSEILARYLRKEGPALAQPADPQSLARESSLSLVMSPRDDVFRDYGPFERWLHAKGRLGLNPLYMQDDGAAGDGISLIRTFPTSWYEQDNAECKAYMPERVGITPEALADLEQGKRTPETEGLADQFVALAMPERYRPYPMVW